MTGVNGLPVRVLRDTIRLTVHVFLIVAVPLAYVYMLVLRDLATQPASTTSIPALKGGFAYLIVLLPLMMMNRFIVRPFSGGGLFLFNAMYDFVVPGAVGFLLYLLFVRDVRGRSPDERFLTLSSFFAGLFTLAGILDLFVRAEYHGAYELFLVPALRITMVLLVPTLYYHYSCGTYWVRYVHLVLMTATPFALGIVPLLASMNLWWVAVSATVVLFLVAWAASLLSIGGVRALRFR